MRLNYQSGSPVELSMNHPSDEVIRAITWDDALLYFGNGNKQEMNTRTRNRKKQKKARLETLEVTAKQFFEAFDALSIE